MSHAASRAPNSMEQTIMGKPIAAAQVPRRIVEPFGATMRRLCIALLCLALFAPRTRAQTSTTTNCSSFAGTVTCYQSANGQAVATTQCSAFGGTTTCNTTGSTATAASSTTNCSTFENQLNCTTTPVETPAQRAAEWQQLGNSVHTIVDRIHERHRIERQQQLAQLRVRYESLQHDYIYGDSLLQAAQMRGDTAAVARFHDDQSEMMRQLRAMGDTATKLSR
jgi:hypothetical protein